MSKTDQTPSRPSPVADAAGARRIDLRQLESQLSTGARAWPIDVVEQTTSTNADLLEALRAERASAGRRADGPSLAGNITGQHPANAQAATRSITGGIAGPATGMLLAGSAGLTNARVRLAYEQTAGRGRRGRSWVAQPGDALLFSVGGYLPRGIEGLVGLSLAVGLAVYEALGELPVDAARLALKWPNDVLVDGAKVSGILIETAGGDALTTAVVVGIGINLHGAATLAARMPTPSAIPGAAPPTPPTALDAIWATPSMTDLLATLLNALERTFTRFGVGGFAPFRAAWCEADAYRDCAVALYEGGNIAVQGIGRGVDAQGQLLLETAQGLRAIASGDVSLRLA